MNNAITNTERYLTAIKAVAPCTRMEAQAQVFALYPEWAENKNESAARKDQIAAEIGIRLLIMKKTTRKAARDLGLPYYNTGKVCKHGHIADRRTSKASCVMCDKMHANKRNRMEQHEAVGAGVKVYWPKQACKNGHFSQRRTSKNACLACDKMNSHIRRAKRLQAIPAWSDSRTISKHYEHTDGYELDHIIPLNNKMVCGLHCSANLVKIPRDINRAKSNKWNSDLLSFLLFAGLDSNIIDYMRLDEAW